MICRLHKEECDLYSDFCRGGRGADDDEDTNCSCVNEALQHQQFSKYICFYVLEKWLFFHIGTTPTSGGDVLCVFSAAASITHPRVENKL